MVAKKLGQRGKSEEDLLSLARNSRAAPNLRRLKLPNIWVAIFFTRRITKEIRVWGCDNQVRDRFDRSAVTKVSP